MASNTLFISGGDINEELETEILEIYTSGPNASVLINADIGDNQKRWLIFGICIQSVLAPTLRKFTEPVARNLYNVTQNTHGIQTQTYPNQLKKYPSSGRDLNYEAINNNHLIPRVRRQPDVGKYDYKVTSHVEFSKLFLNTFMAQYTAFNETCDLSALLGIIINIDKFPQPVQSVALKVRSDVRNQWAHCNFDEWDSLKYQTAFQLMHQLVRCLQLNTTDEADIQAELTKWETRGFMFLQGYGVNQQVVKEIRQQTRALADYTLKMKSGLDSKFAQVHDAMFRINGEIVLACSRISSIESKQNEQQTDIAIENVQKEHGMKIEENVSNTAAIAKNVEILKIRDDSTAKNVSKLENENKIMKEDISDIKTDITEIKVGIKDFRNYMPMSKPSRKTLFYPPNRSETFVAREAELCKLKDICIGKSNGNHTLVICGLGGCGKTTLTLEFAWRSQEFYSAGVFWMSAETQDTLEDSLTSLAIDVDTTGKDFKGTFKRTLSSWKRNTLGHIIITSRREPNEVEELMVVKIEDCINLNVFEKEEGLDFLKRRTGINYNNNDDTIMSLVEELGGLPLALEQAAAHKKSIKCSFSDYVRKFEKKRLKLLKTAPSLIKVNKSRLAIATTWQLNIDYITRQSKIEGLGTAAATVIQIASFLFADDIPLELINVGSPFVDDSSLVEVLEDEMGCKQVIEILTRFSLFQ
ncbi:unnamed protein product [Mytilus coruscus]|uniref:NB-ARC domain-containing protein n=1 Tax=Mytilus coruscus TaxID=42192 RepID=A0A6J8E8W5_MYTCO|nr:unnamed protein product [Mytilus coruscus]